MLNNLPMISLIFAIAAIISITAQHILSTYLWEKQKNNTLQERVDRLTSSLGDAMTLLSEFESEIKTRSALVDNLKKDIKQYNKISKLNKDEVEAIAYLLRGELQKGSRKSFWQGFVINFIFFLLGAFTPSFLRMFFS